LPPGFNYGRGTDMSKPEYAGDGFLMRLICCFGLVAVDVAAVEPLPRPVGLDRIKADRRRAGMVLARQPRLSVQPVTAAEWHRVC
jgi:hypothetical protein